MELTKENYFMNYKKCKIINDDVMEFDGNWSKISIVEYFGKVYYVHLYNGQVHKVKPLDQVKFTEIDEQRKTITELAKKITPKNP